MAAGDGWGCRAVPPGDVQRRHQAHERGSSRGARTWGARGADGSRGLGSHGSKCCLGKYMRNGRQRSRGPAGPVAPSGWLVTSRFAGQKPSCQHCASLTPTATARPARFMQVISTLRVRRTSPGWSLRNQAGRGAVSDLGENPIEHRQMLGLLMCGTGCAIPQLRRARDGETCLLPRGSRLP